MQKILFRADSSSTIGTGHIMRDLVLAKKYPNSKIFFATQDLEGNLNSKILEGGYSVEHLLSNNLDELIELVNKLHIDMIVIDHYGIDYVFEKELKDKTGIKLMVLDDTYEKHYCDILLNHNIYADSTRYKDLVPMNCELRCGEKFTLLREEFLIAKGNKKGFCNETPHILLAIGGADHLNISMQVLRAIDKILNIKIELVTSIANMHLSELRKFSSSKKNITLHVNINYIAKLMSKADFVITTPSVMMNEVLYMNVPFIAIKTANNQKEMYNYLIRNNHIVFSKFHKKEFTNSFIALYEEHRCLKNI